MLLSRRHAEKEQEKNLEMPSAIAIQMYLGFVEKVC